MSEQPLISIIIPVKNGSSTIQKCLDGIESQTYFSKCEVIIIDSGSDDGSLDIVKAFPFVRLYEIPSGDFNHGLTRNLGVDYSKGEFVLMTVQDAIAANEFWVERMHRHFEDDAVVAVIGQQAVPHSEDTNPLQWFRPVSATRVETVCFESREYDAMSGKQKDKSVYYDNVNTMYRKSKLLELPFSKIQFGEDMIWMRDAAMNGWKTVYDSGAILWHYHFKNYSYVFYYTMTVLFFKHKIFAYVPEKAPRMQSLRQILYRSIKFWISPYWFYHNLRILHAETRAYRVFKRMSEKGTDEIVRYYSMLHPEAQIGRQKA